MIIATSSDKLLSAAICCFLVEIIGSRSISIMAKCGACGKFLSPTEGTKCNQCSATYHGACIKVPHGAKLKPDWLCPACKSKRTRNNDAGTPVKDLTEDFILPEQTETVSVNEVESNPNVEQTAKCMVEQTLKSTVEQEAKSCDTESTISQIGTSQKEQKTQHLAVEIRFFFVMRFRQCERK